MQDPDLYLIDHLNGLFYFVSRDADQTLHLYVVPESRVTVMKCEMPDNT